MLPPSITKKYKSVDEQYFQFNKAVIGSTHHLVCAYKPNIAFYEAYGLDGLGQLKKTVLYLKNNYPDIPIIL